VLQAFEQYGIKCIAEFAGAYVGFIHDSRAQAAYLFTDRLGLRGCYYHLTADDTLIFASEFKAIVAVPGFRGTPDDQAISEFLNSGFPFFDRTFFREVKFLPHGTILMWQRGVITRDQYWDLPRVRPPMNWKFEDAVEEGAGLIIQATRRQFRQQGRIGCMLSGGLDSRAIVAGAAGLGHRIPTFSLGSGNNTEQKLARRLAQRLRVANHQLTIHPDFLVKCGDIGIWYTDGMFPCSHLHWLSQLGYLDTHADALLSGYLGGVLLGGVFLRKPHLEEEAISGSADAIATQLAADFSPFVASSLRIAYRGRLASLSKASRREIALAIGGRGTGNELEKMYLATDERRFTNIGNAGMLGTVADLKYPFGDYDLLDLYCRLPVKWRYASRFYKAVLCRAFPELVDIPCISANTQFIPTTLDREPSLRRLRYQRMMTLLRFVLGRATAGRLSIPDRRTYVHYAHWYRTVPALRSWIESILLDQRTLDRGYYSRAGIKKLLRLQMAKGYVFEVLARLVTFEYWNRFFVDGERVHSAVIPSDATRRNDDHAEGRRW